MPLIPFYLQLSLLTNGGIPDDLRRLLNKHANSRDWSVMPADEAHTLQQHANSRQQSLFGRRTTSSSFECRINGLLSWQQRS